MKKNVIFWVGIRNEAHDDKYGNFEYFDYTKATWKHFCKRFDCHFVEFDTPVQSDLFEYRVNWQKAMYVFDILDEKNIEYDQIALVDSTCMYKWDAPNFFELTDRKFVGWRDNDNLHWIYQSVKGYKSVFDDFDLNISEYINSGFIIFNEVHKEFFESFKQLYEDNKDLFIQMQDKLIRKGTEQTPLNYHLQMNNIDVKTDLPLPFKLTHLNRKEMFGHNWQLKNDPMPFFMKYGYNWIFNGIPKDQRTSLIKQIWDMVHHYYDEDHVLNRIDNKDTDKDTTSNKFKEDVLRFFSNHKNDTIVELGSNTGNTTRVYAEAFGKVIGVEHNADRVAIAEQKCSDVDNVEFILADVYNSEFEIPDADVIHIDAGHNHDQVCLDIDRCAVKSNKPFLIFDDCCRKRYPDGSLGTTIRTAVDQKIAEGKIQFIKYIGANNGYRAANGKVLTGAEGMICKVI